MSTAVITDICTCGATMIDGTCLNVDCSAAQTAATKDAVRDTAKVAVKGAKQPEPRSFNISGRVD